jgi:Ubiquitin carboxyl-terminal hydrolase
MDLNCKKNVCCLENAFKSNLMPVKLLNKIGNNICWWNSFAQLFASTRNLQIINRMYSFIASHNCEYNNKCWYCKILNDFITLMTDTNDSTNIDFNKYLFDNPDYIKDTFNNDKLIDHPFIVFKRNKQQDSFEGCNKWFEVIYQITHDIYDMFMTTMIIQTRCNKCTNSRNDNVVSENALSVSIDNHNIKSIQEAVNFFQKQELINVNCDINGCASKLGKRIIKLIHSSNYLIINLKRFALSNGKPIKIHKKIKINENIILKNDIIDQKCYSLIGVLHHIGNTIDSGHYICQCLINDCWYEINDNTYNICLKPDYSTTCYITLWKLIENNLAMNNNDMNSSMLNNAHNYSYALKKKKFN